MTLRSLVILTTPPPPNIHFFLWNFVCLRAKTSLCMWVSQMKPLNCVLQAQPPSLHYYCAVVLHSCIILPHFGHSSNHEYHCRQLTENRAVFRIFNALLRHSVDSLWYFTLWYTIVLMCTTYCYTCSVLVCFVWVLEKRKITSLNAIDCRC